MVRLNKLQKVMIMQNITYINKKEVFKPTWQSNIDNLLSKSEINKNNILLFQEIIKDSIFFGGAKLTEVQQYLTKNKINYN